MSYALDVNILVYASDSSSPLHGQARAFLDHCATSPDMFYLSWGTVMSYLRLITHPAICSQPLSPGEAMGNLDALVSLPHVRLLSEETGYWEVYREIARVLPVRGNLVPDAHLAALLRQHGVRTLYTNDADFLKFDFLEVRNPFKPVRSR
jgi:toxin-antitoxin system PIN domain toxin